MFNANMLAPVVASKAFHFANLPISFTNTQNSFCGNYHHNMTISIDDAVVNDRFGNAYTYYEVANIPSSSASASTTNACDCASVGVNTGFFDLFFEDCNAATPIGFHNTTDPGGNKKRAVCQAFADLASIINKNTNPCPESPPAIVSIKVKASDNQYLVTNPSVLAAASPFYPADQRGFGTITGFPWKVINGGIENFLALGGSIFHGYIMFRDASVPGFTDW